MLNACFDCLAGLRVLVELESGQKVLGTNNGSSKGPQLWARVCCLLASTALAVTNENIQPWRAKNYVNL